MDFATDYICLSLYSDYPISAKFSFALPPPKAEPEKKKVVVLPSVGKNKQNKASFITAIPVKKSSYE
jgi:hypothetical protein